MFLDTSRRSGDQELEGSSVPAENDPQFLNQDANNPADLNANPAEQTGQIAWTTEQAAEATPASNLHDANHPDDGELNALKNAGGGNARRSAWFTILATIASMIFVVLLTTDVQKLLKPASFAISTSESGRGIKIITDNFGDSFSIAILAEAPKATLDVQGPKIVKDLRSDDTLRINSAWDAEGGKALRPNDNAALIMLEQETGQGADFIAMAQKLEGRIKELAGPNVKLSFSGGVDFAIDMKERFESVTKTAELIAFPALLITLLLVFKSPFAAIIPLFLGLAANVLARGIMWIAAHFMELDPAALTIAASLGLALGVDYALLIVSRFREERDLGFDVHQSARIAKSLAGRTVMMAGSTLVIVMIVGSFVVPGSLLLSMTVGVISATLAALIPATCTVPAILTLMGGSIEKWRLPGQPWGGTKDKPARWLKPIDWSLNRPLATLLPILLILGILSIPLIALKTGPSDVRQLPASSHVRQDNERINSVMGPGWAWAYTIAVEDKNGPLTSSSGLKALSELQNEINDTPGIAQVLGPGVLEERLKPVTKAKSALSNADAQLKSSDNGLKTLSGALGDAVDGASSLVSGLGAASEAATKLAGGGNQLVAGAAKLSNGAGAAAAGAGKISRALSEAGAGAGKLSGSSSELANGNREVDAGITKLRKTIDPIAGLANQLPSLVRAAADDVRDLAIPAEQAGSKLANALATLQGLNIDKNDPQYKALLETINSAKASLDGAASGNSAALAPALRDAANQMENVAGQLSAGPAQQAKQLRTALAQLDAAGNKLAAGALSLAQYQKQLGQGLNKLSVVTGQLQNGLNQLSGGSQQLASGAQQMQAGQTALATKLGEGQAQGQALPLGLDKMRRGVNSQRKKIPLQRKQLADFKKQSPEFFMSPYTQLALLDGAPKDQRQLAGQTLAIDKGGRAARIIAIPDFAPNTPEATAVGDQLRQITARVNSEGRFNTAVTGLGGFFDDYNRITKSKIPLLVGGMLVGCCIALMLLFRAVLLSLIAVALNVVTVAVTFGILTILLNLPSRPLGDAPYIDVIQAIGIFAVLFGLSIDYQVFLLARMREARDKGMSTRAAIETGLRSTAGVVTGAALAIIVVFLALAIEPIAPLRQLGIGLSIAIALDATVVRLVLLPAVLRLFGDKIWWMPEPIAKRLPTIQH